jgi:hypothetical protein
VEEEPEAPVLAVVDPGVAVGRIANATAVAVGGRIRVGIAASELVDELRLVVVPFAAEVLADRVRTAVAALAAVGGA